MLIAFQIAFWLEFTGEYQFDVCVIDLFVLPHTDSTGSGRQLVLQGFSKQKVHTCPRPVLPHSNPPRPAVIMRLPYLLPNSPQRKRGAAKGRKKEKFIPGVAGTHSVPHSTLVPPPPLLPPRPAPSSQQTCRPLCPAGWPAPPVSLSHPQRAC